LSQIKTYKNLRVWQKTLDIVDKAYLTTNSFPEEEKFGLISQIRRCSVSIASNIAEGCGRKHTKSFVNYLRIAKGSLYELETQLIISQRLHLTKTNEIDILFEMIYHEVRMLNKMISSLIDNLLDSFNENEVKYDTFSTIEGSKNKDR